MGRIIQRGYALSNQAPYLGSCSHEVVFFEGAAGLPPGPRQRLDLKRYVEHRPHRCRDPSQWQCAPRVEYGHVEPGSATHRRDVDDTQVSMVFLEIVPEGDGEQVFEGVGHLRREELRVGCPDPEVVH